MEQKAGAQISTRAFIQSLVILFVLMIAAGVLTRVIPAGSYTLVEQGDRQVIDPASFQYIDQPDYPAWRWFSAPLEVLWGPDGLTIVIIIVFLLMVGVAFAVLDRSGLLKSALGRIVGSFGGRKYSLLLITVLFLALGVAIGYGPF